MADTSLESNGDVASQDRLSLFDEDIVFDQDPNEAYFRYMVGMNDDNDEEDNVVVVENEEEEANWTPMSEVRKTLPPPIPPPENRTPEPAAPVPVNQEVDLELAEAERKKQERAARIANVPPVIYVGDEPDVHLNVHAKNNTIMPDWASLSATTNMSFISRNRRLFMTILLLFLVAVIGLAVALVVNFQRSNDPSGPDNPSTVSSGQDGTTGDDVDLFPSSAPSEFPTLDPAQQTETTAAPVQSPTTNAQTEPTQSSTTTSVPTMPQQTTTMAPPVTGISPTVSPTTLPPTMAPTPVPTTAPPTKSPTAPPTKSPTASPTAAPTVPSPTSSPPTGTISSDLQELITLLSDASPDGGAALSNPSSPQFLAAKWLSEESSFPSYPDWKRLQRYAIATIYFSTGGDEWFNTDGWLTDSDECDWYETRDEDDVCSDSGRFRVLYIEGNNLEGQLPAEISLLSDTLVRLDVSENSLSGTIPSEFGLLTALRKISLKRNAGIGGPLPTEIGRMASMTFFGVGRTDLTGTLPTEIGMLTALKTIGFERNNLVGKIPTEFGRLRLLEQAAFDFNELTGSVPTQLLELPNLEKLALEYNRLTGVVEFEDGCPIDLLKADCDEVVCPCCNQCS